MSLTILGQTGGPTQLSANDSVIGLMTQVPSGSVNHSPDGLTGGDGNSAFGTPIHLLAYATHTTTPAVQTTTVTFTSDGMPYKLRVLGVKVRCLAGSPRDFQPGYGYVRATVEDSDGSGVWTSVLNVEGLGDMNPGDVREQAVIEHSNAVIAANEGLRVKISTKSDSNQTNPTASFIVELQCIRVL